MLPSERVEPLGGDDRIVDGPLLTAWWAAISIGVPGLLVGMNLAHPSGLGLSLGQIILLVPIGALVAGALAAVVAAMGASVGVPFGLLTRPSLGVVLGGLVGPLRAVMYVGLLAWQLSVLRDVALSAYSAPSAQIVIGGLIVAAIVLFIVGADNSIRYFIRWPAFWGGIFVSFGLLWRISSLELGFAGAPGVGFWRGLDDFVWLTVLLVPLIVDSARMIDDEAAAPSAVAFGFSVPTVLIVVGGASLAAATGLVGSAAIASILGGASIVAVILAVGWVVFAEVDQAFSAIFSAEMEVATFAGAVPRVVTAGVLLLGAGAGAILLTTETLTSVMDGAVRGFAPIVGVVVADYFFVRHSRYETDDMFRLRGEYPIVNSAGVLAWLAGVAFAEWLDPVLLAGFGWSSAATDAPATLAAVVMALLVYTVAGRLLVREAEYVADVRF